MPRKFHHLTNENRIAISTLLRAGHSKDAIAKQLGFHRSTIFREIARNGTRLDYLPLIAERKIEARCKRSFKLNHDTVLRNYILDKLKLSWSPEQIAGRLKLENQGKSLICHETIYAYLYSDYGIRNKYYQFLRYKRYFRYPKVCRHHRIKIPHRVSIHERPQEINDRLTLGHWEGDLIHFGRKTQTNLITLRERYSRYLIAIKNANRRAENTANKIIFALENFKTHKVKTVTFDNGFEFSKHEKIAEKLQIKTYFCDPYKSYQKDSIENGNRQLREWLPKDAPIDRIPQQKIEVWTAFINQRPMKCLNYKTPEEIFFNNCDKMRY